jgi:ferredoxin
MENAINIFVIDLEGVMHTIEAPTDMSLNLMEAIKANELQIKATCGGMALCATCHVVIKSTHLIPEMQEAEEAMLDEAFLLDIQNSRLSCQIQITENLDGLVVQLGESTGE